MPIVHDKFEQLPNGKWRPVVSKPAAVANDNRVKVDPIGDALANRIVNNLVSKRSRNSALDAAADNEIRNLLPALRLQVAMDDVEGEQQQYGEPEAADEELNEKAGIVNVSEQDKTRLDWLAINQRNRAGRGRDYAPVASNASKGH